MARMATTWEELDCISTAKPAFLLSIGVAAALAFLFHRFVFRERNPARYEVPVPAELSPSYAWDLTCLQDGTALEAEVRDGKIYPRCPADGRSLGEPIVPASPSDIDDAVEQARAAQHEWSNTTFSERRRVLRSLLKHVLAHQDDIVRACCLDSGKTQVDACFGEILVTAEKLQWTIKHGEKALKPSRRPANLLMCYKKNTVRYEPLGVVAACVSWNYPFHNFISPVISALFAGNAIVVKPSEQTCWSAAYFLAIIRGSLVACGHSGELVQSVVCLPKTADHLTSHSGLSHITFIGSRDVAFKVCNSAAQVLTPVTVELGGKDPAIVDNDARTLRKLEDVCAILLRGTFQSAGQNCIGIERVIALPKAYEKIIQIVEPKIQAVRLGSTTLADGALDMGAMISDRSFDRLEGLIAAAVKQGAKLHCGGRRFKHGLYPKGHYFQPTFLSNVNTHMEIAQTELFAPVFLLMRAADSNDAIEIANGTSYGLGASVFCHNPYASKTYTKDIRSGMVAVNDFGAFYACSLPFGGVKGSGYGRFGGDEGLRGLCNIKAICEDSWWATMLGMRTRIPPQLQYPIKDGANAWQTCKGVVETGYAVSLQGRVQGVAMLVGAMLPRGGMR